jgi:hypothetical protein
MSTPDHTPPSQRKVRPHGGFGVLLERRPSRLRRPQSPVTPLCAKNRTPQRRIAFFIDSRRCPRRPCAGARFSRPRDGGPERQGVPAGRLGDEIGLERAAGTVFSVPDPAEPARTTADCRGTGDLNPWKGLTPLYPGQLTKPLGLPSVSAAEITAAAEAKRPRSVLPASLPPRGLSVEQASAYVGLSVPSFLAEVKLGRYPGHVPSATRRQVWDRHALDRAMDLLSGLELPETKHEGEGVALYDADRKKLRAAIAQRRSERR